MWQKETDLANANVEKMAASIKRDVKIAERVKRKERERDEAAIPKDNNMMQRPHTVGSGSEASLNTTTNINYKPPLNQLNNSQELFSEMKQKKAEQLAAICPRFMSLPPTDWTRTGCGGNGVDPNSAGYKSFRNNTTTTNDYYPPIIYVPNQPVSRNLMSDSQKGFEEKKSSAYKRKKRTDSNFRTIMERVKMEETMQSMNEDQKLKEKVSDQSGGGGGRGKARNTFRATTILTIFSIPLARSSAQSTAMLNYFSTIYAADAKLQKKESGNGLLKKSHPKFAHRMWGGSDASPFHVTQLHSQKVDFTTSSSDFGAHSLNRTGGGAKKVQSKNSMLGGKAH